MKRPKDDVLESTPKITYFDSYVKHASGKVNYFDSKTFNIWNYLRVEMFGIGEPGTLEPPNQEHIENFFLVPLNLESLIFLGFFICLDAFLYVITYLPIRVIFSIYLLLVHCYQYICAAYLSKILPFLFPTRKSGTHSSGRKIGFHRTQGYDIMRGLMFAVGCVTLRQINMSQVYHFIRGQSMVKLYVLTSMLEIFDKLLSSFGQDAFDALHRHTRSHPRSFQLFLTFLMVTAYVSIHSCVYFFHVATLTVVINSVDSALITVLILNNFAEMKTFILKKFDCNNLFQLACSDITERFQTFLFLVLILIVALAQAGSAWYETLYSFTRIGLMMLVGECFADWFKHAFINKFNLINASVYQDFAYVLRNDILSNQKDEIILDHTYSVTRRLGLSQIPLGCVCVRYLNLALVTPAVQMYVQEQSLTTSLLQGMVIFGMLVLMKVLIGVGLVFYAAGAHKRDAAVFLRSPAAVKTSDRISSGSGTGTFHSAPVGSHAASAAGTQHSTPRIAVGQHPLPGHFRHTEPLPGIAVVGHNTENSGTTTPMSHTSASHGGAPLSLGRPRGHSITNPFAEAHVTGDEVRMAVLVSGIEGATEFVTTQLEHQQQYVGLNCNIIPNITDQTPEKATHHRDKDREKERHNEIERDRDYEVDSVSTGEWTPGAHLDGRSPPQSPARSNINSLAHTVGHSHNASSGSMSRSRPPLGKLSLHNANTSHSHSGATDSKAGRPVGSLDGMVTPPMSPHSRTAVPVAGGACSELHTQSHTSSHTPTHTPSHHTSIPIVQLDTEAYTAAAHANQPHMPTHAAGAAAAATQQGQHSRYIDTNQDAASETSDLEETRSNFSDVPRMAALEDHEAARLRERLEFMEELSSIERYTVYKGRII